MIRPLRKRHLQVWSALSLLIPVGIVTAWLSVKQPTYDRLQQPASSQELGHVIAYADGKDYTVRLRGKGTQPEQLEWVNKNVLTVPSAVIYRMPANLRGSETDHSFLPAQAELIGRIEARGTYYFPLRADSSAAEFVLYDFIHQKIIDTIKFQNSSQ